MVDSLNSYTISQWFLFFFIYCFLGWVWESCFVSVKSKKWVNRGFLHGPALPIYGSGAVVILASTIGVREYALLVFLFGMASSTLLEYVTGKCMERMFGVRYWDYSDKPLNVNGYICLFVSVGWGFFSIFMVYLIHKPIETLVFLLPQKIGYMLVFLFSIGMAVDYTQSFNEAMDLKATLQKITQNNEQVRTLAKKLAIVSAFAEEDYNKLKEKLSLETEMLRSRIADEGAVRLVLAKFEEEREHLCRKTNKETRSVARIMGRNPGALSTKYAEAMHEIKRILKQR